jgi:glycerol uptake facilitator-like aquaporin
LSPLNFGLTVMFIIQLFGHISYAIINPAVVIAAIVHKLISIRVRLIHFQDMTRKYLIVNYSDGNFVRHS